MNEEDEQLFMKFWKTKALRTIQFYAWKALLDKLSTYENLCKTRSLISANSCVFCQTQAETLSTTRKLLNDD